MLPTISLNTRTAAILCIKLPGDYSVRPLSQGEFRAASHVMEINKVPTSDMLTLSAAQLTKMFNGEELLCERILSLRDRHHKIENVLKSWSENGIWILGEEDDFYPKRLKDRLTSSRPPLLFGFGPFDSLNDGGLLVVGSRNSSPKAIEFSETLAKRCAKEAITVISSNMRGVDRAAIQTAYHRRLL